MILGILGGEDPKSLIDLRIFEKKTIIQTDITLLT